MTIPSLHPSATDAAIIPIGVAPGSDPGATLTTAVTLGRLVGRGAVGAVYEAHDHTLERTIALKVLLPRPDGPTDLLREAMAAARVTHPHLLPILGTGTFDDAPCFAMPYVAGGSLADAGARIGRIELRTLALITRQIAGALDALHAAQLIHRDVKPANVLLTDPDDPHPHAYLTDFGAGLSLHDAAHGPDALRPIGTLGFAAPEQLDGRRCDARTDVYGLGATVYFALTGEVPNPSEDSIVPVTDLRPDLDPLINSAIGRALHVDPTARYASASSAAEAMSEPLSRGSRPTLVGPSLRVTTPSAPGRRFGPGDDGHGPGRRSVIVAAVLVVLLALAALFVLVRPFDRSAAPRPTPAPTNANATTATGPNSADGSWSQPERTLARAVPLALRSGCTSSTAYNALASLTCTDKASGIVTTYWQFADASTLDAWYQQFTAMFPVTSDGSCARGESADTTWRARKTDPAPAGRLRCSTMPGFSTVMWTTNDLRIFAAAKSRGDLASLWKWWQTTPGPVRP